MRRRYAFIFCFAALCITSFPSATFSQDASSESNILPAGFAAAPIWISSASSTGGDSLKIFAIVNNTSTTTVNGTVSFLVDGTSVGSVDISLAAGAANIFSVPWTAVAGTHSITATLDNPVDANGLPVSLSETVAGPISITVAEAPPAPLAVQYFNAAMNDANSVAGPALSGALAAVDSARQDGANYFATQLGLGTASASPQGQVLGAETENIASATPTAQSTNGFMSLLDRLGYYIFENPILFYPLFIILIFIALWILSSVFSRK